MTETGVKLHIKSISAPNLYLFFLLVTHCHLSATMLLPEFILLLFCLAVVTSGARVLEGKEIDKVECQGDSCGTLYLLTDTNEEVGMFKGTHTKVKAKNVKKARIVGSGYFKIFKNKGFKGSEFLVKGSGILDLSEHGHTWTTVK